MKNAALYVGLLVALPCHSQQPTFPRTQLVPVIEADGAHTWAATIVLDKSYQALSSFWGIHGRD